MKFFSQILFGVFLLSVAFVAYLKPHYNWDMLGYMGCVLSIEEHQPAAVHAATYNYAKSELPEKDYQLLTNSASDYRKKNLEDAGYFQQQLSLYSIKPLYVLLIYLFYKAGIPLTDATVLPSLIAYVFIGILLFYWMQKVVSGAIALSISGAVMLSPPMWEIALSSTPDALAGFLAFIAFFLIIENKKMNAGLLLLLVCIAVRIDFVLLVLMTLFFLRFYKTPSPRITATTFLFFSVMSIFTFCIIAFGLGHFNGSTLGYYTIVQSDFVKQFGTNPAVQYFVLLIKGIYSSRYALLSLFLLLAMTTFFLRKASGKESDFENRIVLLLLFNILLRYLLHPVIEDRFLIVHYLVITIIFMKTLFEQKKNLPAESK